VYEIQLADERYAVSGAKSLLVSISGVTGAAETDATIPLTDTNPYDAVRGGLTALPNAAAGAEGGLPILAAGGAYPMIVQDTGEVSAYLATYPSALRLPVNVLEWGGIAIASAYVQADAAKIGGSATAATNMLPAVRFLTNKWSTSASTLTVYAENGTSPAYTSTLTTDENGGITGTTGLAAV
jgi:hypothetical protein